MIEISPKSTAIKSNWNDAILYCAFLEVDGKNDWRLPTIEELNEICKSENDFVCDFHWSSTEYNAKDAWYYGMGEYGDQDTEGKYNRFCARAVRDV